MADEEVVYEDMTVEELRDELSNRGLSTSGLKAELIARLDEDDAAQNGGETPAEPTTPTEPTEVVTVTVEDAQGNDIEVEAGRDGENPVSPENPPEAAVTFDPEADVAAPYETVTVEDGQGNEIEVEAGMDGESAVSPNNPPEKAVVTPAYEPPPPTPVPEIIPPEPEPEPEQPVGLDEENPVSAENPDPKAVVYDPEKADEEQRRIDTVREDQKA